MATITDFSIRNMKSVSTPDGLMLQLRSPVTAIVEEKGHTVSVRVSLINLTKRTAVVRPCQTPSPLPSPCKVSLERLRVVDSRWAQGARSPA